jgi:membrane-bound acyltransferase YfiQ involved in biofilm formation
MDEVTISPGFWAVSVTLRNAIYAGYNYVEYLDYLRKYDWVNKAISEDEYNEAKLLHLIVR